MLENLSSPRGEETTELVLGECIEEEGLDVVEPGQSLRLPPNELTLARDVALRHSSSSSYSVPLPKSYSPSLTTDSFGVEEMSSKNT
jgi:hypothetical protein